MWGTAASAQSGSGIERFIPTHVGNGSSTGVDYIRVAVHPHACGERLMPSVCTMTLIGSSPRMWGTVNPQQFDQWLARFIPTHVGNGRTSAPRPSVAAVHPHACGERWICAARLALSTGSSPRMWGTVSLVAVAVSKQRFIPTHVGNGLRPDQVHVTRRFIPTHVGNGIQCAITSTGLVGSSPRMWGTVGSIRLLDPHSRFIPTHVGNGWGQALPARLGTVHPHACGERATKLKMLPPTAGSSPRMWGTGSSVAPRLIPFTVHPHACGERLPVNSISASQYGSSPRMWGTGQRRYPSRSHLHGSSPRMWGTGEQPPAVAPRARFIPTHVGNGARNPPSAFSAAVHPHACGERGVYVEVNVIPAGSSPRMWGTGRHLDEIAGHRRFIPTHVGNGACCCALWWYRTVHPHACGERRPVHRADVHECGSSPRMWGTAVKCVPKRTLARFIPTHVGNGARRDKKPPRRSVHPHACGERDRDERVHAPIVGSSPRMWGTVRPDCG